MAKSKSIEFGAAMDRVAKKTVTEEAIDRLAGAPAQQDPKPAPTRKKKKAEKKALKECRINLRVTSDLLADIEAMAHFNQMTVTAYLTELVKKDLEENASFLSTFRKMQEVRATLAGSGR